ncbi:protein FAR1-RELATED SEQUENCE 4-like [Cornus florida]|uniref:protein FAR1-RELATED SEQUENCE 4-like n=1 Tax=Cornus florida TaxID=4283 RepID=UPI002898DB6B|nr:protein FAR1-RELATED SEQUENCE 4-like [Cornus florida]
MEEGCHMQVTSNEDFNDGEKIEGMLPGDEVEKPMVGMVFPSEEEIRSYYNNYAKSQGFGVIKISAKNGRDGKSRYFSLTCAKYGNRNSTRKDRLHPRPLTKTNCKAKINITAKDDGRFIIVRVYLDHNHALSPGKVRHFQRNKVLDSHVKRKLELNDTAGIKLNKNFHALVVEAGRYENLTFGEKECRNYIEKARRL